MENFTVKYACARVSTRKQSRDGNGLDEQFAKLQAVGFDELVVEEFTGATTKRSCLDALIERLQAGNTLIITKLDRFARSTADGSALINEWINRGVSGHIMLAFAECERDMINRQPT